MHQEKCFAFFFVDFKCSACKLWFGLSRQISEYLWTRCSFPTHLAEFNWERRHRLTATVKVICPPCAVYCRSSKRPGLSTLIMCSVLIVCLWDNGAAEKRISSCSDFHQCSCQTFSLFTLHLPTRPFSPERCWGDGRLQFVLFPPSDGRKTQILQCRNTIIEKYSLKKGPVLTILRQ